MHPSWIPSFHGYLASCSLQATFASRHTGRDLVSPQPLLARDMTSRVPASPLVVVKVGGSLLTLPDLAERLSRLRDSRPGMRAVFVVGGGAVADVVRQWDALFNLGEPASHDLALESLNITAGLLTRLLPRAVAIESLRDAEDCWRRGECPVMRLPTWMKGPEADGAVLPHSWDVTSDSLAAWLAIRWGGEELWLLKSIDLPERMTATNAAREGLVDRFFPHLAVKLRNIFWCHLRSETPELIRWAASD
jgi:aspartokinase-like uncharacterized kinase